MKADSSFHYVTFGMTDYYLIMSGSERRRSRRSLPLSIERLNVIPNEVRNLFLKFLYIIIYSNMNNTGYFKRI